MSLALNIDWAFFVLFIDIPMLGWFHFNGV